LLPFNYFSGSLVDTYNLSDEVNAFDIENAYFQKTKPKLKKLIQNLLLLSIFAENKEIDFYRSRDSLMI
jgi:hypothetical protein